MLVTRKSLKMGRKGELLVKQWSMAVYPQVRYTHISLASLQALNSGSRVSVAAERNGRTLQRCLVSGEVRT